MSARYEVIPSGWLECNSVVVWDTETLEAVLIDPSDESAHPLGWIAEQGLKVRAVLLTHGHFDHAGDAERAAQHLGVPLRMHIEDRPLYRKVADHARLFGCHAEAPTRDPEPLAEGDEVRISDALMLQTLHVPGHTRGGVAFYLAQGPFVFAGDTLFAGAVGRTDLPGGSFDALFDSIQNKLYRLPDDCAVIPGHGPSSSIGHEKQHNGYVRASQ